MANDFGTGKSVFILAIVAGCFAILWPNVFYPMITGDYEIKSDSHSSGCCDVIFDNDVNGIKIMTELCEKILNRQDNNKTIVSFTEGKLTKNIIDLCKKTVYEKCNLDITELITRNMALGKDYKQTLELLRTLNSSICLRESFGISLGQIGLPRQMKVWGLNASKHMKPERPPHLHPEIMHPALREKGRAIQQSQKEKAQQQADPRPPPPIPGMRPTLGGAGHVVPPPKGGGTMGIVMPMYTIGIVVFFLYTMLKLLFKKSGDTQNYDDMNADADFQRDVFAINPDYIKDKMSSDTTRLGDMELEMLKERLEETEKAMERIVAKMMSLPSHSANKDAAEADQSKIDESKEETVQSEAKTESDQEAVKDSEMSDSCDRSDTEGETKTGVKVVGMETTESCQGGKWKHEAPRPQTPQNIYIPAVLPDQSKIIVTNSSIETIPSSEDNAPVVLSGKVTLSLIGIQDSEMHDGESSSDEILCSSDGDMKCSSESDNLKDSGNNVGQSISEDSSVVSH